jgi:hypothetical protein
MSKKTEGEWFFKVLKGAGEGALDAPTTEGQIVASWDFAQASKQLIDTYFQPSSSK